MRKKGFKNDSNKTKFSLFLIKKNGPVSGRLLSRLPVPSLDQTRWSWTHQPSCSNLRTQTAVCIGSMPSSLSDHTACQHDHEDGCPAANSLWDFLDTPDRMHSDCQQEKLKHKTKWDYRIKRFTEIDMKLDDSMVSPHKQYRTEINIITNSFMSWSEYSLYLSLVHVQQLGYVQEIDKSTARNMLPWIKIVDKLPHFRH